MGSWAVFFTSVRLVSRHHALAQQLKNRFNNWFMLLALNIIVMCTSSYDFKTKQQYMSNKWHSLTKLALLVGVITSFISFVTVLLMSTTFCEKWQSKFELFLSLINTVIYAVTVGYINGSEGPGAYIGNTYYFTWLSFLMSTLLTIECCDDVWTSWWKPKDIEQAELDKDSLLKETKSILKKRRKSRILRMITLQKMSS